MANLAASLALTLAVGGAGGFLVASAGFPGGWIIGAISASFAASALKAPLQVPSWLRSLAMGFAGMTVGAAVDPDLLQAAAVLPFSLLAMFVLLGLLSWLVYEMHRRGWHTSGATAVSCAWPGNVLQAFAGAQALGADMERVTVVQLVRVVILMGLLPLAVGSMSGLENTASTAPTLDFWLAIPLTLACTAVAMRLRLTAGEMFLSAIAIGGLSAAGVMQFDVPEAALAGLQVLVGVYIGLSLARCSRAAFMAALAPSLIGAVLAAAVTLIGGYALEGPLGYSAASLALAFAPGGAEAMILLSAMLGADPAFVGIHHTVRLILMTVLFPLVMRRFAPPTTPRAAGRGRRSGNRT